MIKKTCVVFINVIALLIAAASSAQELSVDEIIKKANEVSYYAGKDGRADVKMSIVDKRGDIRIREFSILRLDVQNRDQKFYVYFKAPADVRKMAFLVWKHADKDDDRWLWLPALSLVKRIAPGDKRTSFVGSDFLYEDVSGRGIREDKHDLIERTDTQYLVRNEPKNPKSVEFSYYNVWIDKSTFLPRKAEYYDKNGKLYRTVEAVKIENVEGHPTVVESVASDLKAGSSTKNVFSNIKYDVGLKERIFTERFLRRAPREATK